MSTYSLIDTCKALIALLEQPQPALIEWQRAVARLRKSIAEEG